MTATAGSLCHDPSHDRDYLFFGNIWVDGLERIHTEKARACQWCARVVTD